ncbi:MAG: hypothetical protein AVDCRST_MAG85-2548 [uncultured Solirubrobacteraceae bacterium]|uniref:CcmD family protein n=1 Tax=uncultured Solirubrobacteraceae bacterium TaxID=1162706 RepID=A0A6J4T6R9_9ACTN|nr:MAG: hypothetical protein AVDCRST_MAG85-2548 [uncultured Solirubrobacteraceae bacterium]
MNEYVAAAYLVFLALILIYVVIMAVRQTRLEKDLAEIAELVERRAVVSASEREPERVLSASEGTRP